MVSRRLLLGSALAAPLVPILPAAAGAASDDTMGVKALFDGLPGDKAIKIVAPATDSAPQLYISSNASTRLFVGSAIKTFVLAEALIQADTPDVTTTIANRQLTLDQSVWSADSAIFNPPNLIGTVTERTALEAMIIHSDNTATDMALKYVGPDKVRNFISSIGLRSTAIPDSTRTFFGYLLNAPDYKTFTWADLQAAASTPIVNSPLNDVETLASSADDFVSYYRRALQGEFFKSPETLNEFRRILSLGDVIYIVDFPLGTSVFAKGGSIDVAGFHCLCVPGGMFFNGRWVYFCFTINWYAQSETDPATVTAFLAAVNQALQTIHKKLSA